MQSNDKINLLLTLFRTSYMLEKDKVDFSEDYVKTKVQSILSIQPNVILLDSEYLNLINSIYAEYEVHQEDGIALLPEYGHDEWYDESKVENNFFWHRYKRFLNETTDIKVDDLEKKTLNRLVSLLGNPNFEGEFRRRGLVIGDVQSGKTATYIGLISKAVDAGYKLIVLLSGTMENLRKQTQERVEEGFVGFDTFRREPVGVGLFGYNDSTPYSLTSTDNDYTGILDRTTVLHNIEKGTPIIFVIKKNSKVLSKLFEGLKVSRRGKKVTAPMLMIDDEADNASINTNKNDSPTKINESIRKILSICEKSNYVGFTATPFANVFIDPESQEEMLGSDLFPEDFIFAMFPPSNYIGAKDYFVDNNKKNVVRIRDDNPIYFKHTKEWRGEFPFLSFFDAIITFFLANVIRDYRGDDNKHRTMLINVSRFSSVHYQIQKNVDEFLKKLRDSITLNIYKTESELLQNEIIARIHKVWVEQYRDDISWSEVVLRIENSTKAIYTVVINSTSKNKLKYGKENGERVIAIGGIALSRGLTMEGLVVSYFYRNTCTFDVLMQMGRWFGYRKGYEDICRVYIPPKSEGWYKEIAESIETLKLDMKLMFENQLSPKEFGIRVRNDSDELGITSRSKMRSTLKRDEFKDFYGNVFEAPYITDNVIQNTKHVTAVRKLVNKLGEIDASQRHPYYRNVEKMYIIEFLNELSFSRLNGNFDLNQINKFIFDSKFNLFDVLFMQGEGKRMYEISKELQIRPLIRTFDIKIDKIEKHNQVVRSMGQRARVGGPDDTKNGLTSEQLYRLKNNENLVETAVNKNKIYMLDDRNPLLIVYFIELKVEQCSDHEILIARKYNDTDYPLVTFAIGIPNLKQNEGLNVIQRDGHKYVVPFKYDYYNLYGKEDDIEYEAARDVEV